MGKVAILTDSNSGITQEEAKKLGNPRTFNLVVLGVAAQHMDFTKEQWFDVIERTVPPKTIEINKKAFEAGFNL